MHNSTVNVRLRLLVGFSRVWGLLLTPSLSIYHIAFVCGTHTIWLHVNDTSSVVGLKGAQHHPSAFILLPSRLGASLNVFPFHYFRLYDCFKQSGVVANTSSVLAWVLPTFVRRGSVGLSSFMRVTPHYAFQATYTSVVKQRFWLIEGGQNHLTLVT